MNRQNASRDCPYLALTFQKAALIQWALSLCADPKHFQTDTLIPKSTGKAELNPATGTLAAKALHKEFQPQAFSCKK